VTSWPAPIERFAEVASTNDVLKERARRGAPEWTVVLAERQSAGRGRQGRAWASPAGNVYLSVLLRPRFAAVSVVPLAAGLAVAEALPQVQARLKWPNDVLVNGRKLAGILAEAQSGPSGVEHVVLGIGVNVAPAELPPELRESATSLFRETGLAAEPEEVAAAVLGRLRVCYDALAQGNAAALLERWRERSLPWWGREVEARAAGGTATLRGIARGVSEQGALLIEGPDGTVHPVLAGDVQEMRAR
jgi:BirA family transcriptional regulator, biotin operon repressor / biotin---[acetyl-CoA-carboxylase] ligase